METGARDSDCRCYGICGFFLTDDAAGKFLLEVQESLFFARNEGAEGDTGGAGYDQGDIILRHDLTQKLHGTFRPLCGQCGLQLRYGLVHELRGQLKFTPSLCHL